MGFAGLLDPKNNKFIWLQHYWGELDGVDCLNSLGQCAIVKRYKLIVMTVENGNTFKKLGASYRVKYSPDGKYLISGDINGNVNIFDTSTYSLIKSFHFPGLITSISFNSKQKLIAISSQDNLVHIISQEDFSEKYTIRGNVGIDIKTKFNLEGNLIAIFGFHEMCIQIVKIPSLELLLKIESSELFHEFIEDNKCIIFASGQIESWDILKKQKISSVSASSFCYKNYTKDGKYAISTIKGNSIIFLKSDFTKAGNFQLSKENNIGKCDIEVGKLQLPKEYFLTDSFIIEK